jgi:putative FmdB family regulatory protein
MPNYDYRCEKCGHHFEVLQSMSAEPVAECPQCKGSVKRLIGGGAGVHFKGTGFYQTDYKKSSGGCEKSSSGGCAGCPNKSA